MPPAARIRGIKAEQPCLFFPANGHDVDFLFRHARNHHHGVIQDKVRRPFNRAGGYRGGTPRLQIQPAELTAEETAAILETVMKETGASTKKDMGQVMKLMQERTAGRVNGKELARMVSARLS